MDYNVTINVSSLNNSNVDVSVSINNVKQQKHENSYEEQQQPNLPVPSERADAHGGSGGQCTLRTPALGGGIPPTVSAFTDNLGPGLHIRF